MPFGTPRADPAAITRRGLAPALVLQADGTADGNADELWRTSAADSGSRSSDLSSRRTSTDAYEQTCLNCKTAIAVSIPGVAFSKLRSKCQPVRLTRPDRRLR